ncbi:type I methionyl aminopeptidase [Patescibacteria group bacterium]|nr:type I methionyl aminopeptidase [Patescibacteria group bacterium]MBU4274919.1 type I methionyl aminopeptidase [Patescibacteria group bacterium]MBU4367899.1 type I methionyl aminopeptidase [Patescibacteria group bacterium]MBU4461924.1 type I methionyl aminopeptidase [Patescibacteria group bacterium]MCG2699867.1 type I methionyl aminopeptidase [Candidatus Parcubacteria bacterium]
MISIKTKEEIEIIKEGGKILAKIMRELEKMAKPGITTKELDGAAEALILKHGAKPSFKGYKGFPSSLCTSVNEEIVHVIPSDRVLEEGDIVSLDLGALYKGFHTDMAITVGIGKISKKARELIKTTRETLDFVIKKIKPGINTNEVGGLIEKFIEKKGFGVVRELCGHGIGKNIHEDPQIPNYRDSRQGAILKEGMIICLEPMVTIGDWHIKKAKDNYGFQTKDNSLAAHFEHTIAVTKDGSEVLTLHPSESDF